MGSCSGSACSDSSWGGNCLLADRFAFGRASRPLSKVASIRRALPESNIVSLSAVIADCNTPLGCCCSFTFMPEPVAASSGEARLRLFGGSAIL